MNNIPGFPEEIKRLIYEAQRGYCKNCLNQIHSVHHKLHNTVANRKKYPLFIHSIFNAVGLCYSCHKNKQHLFRVTYLEARIYERYLEELKNE